MPKDSPFSFILQKAAYIPPSFFVQCSALPCLCNTGKKCTPYRYFCHLPPVSWQEYSWESFYCLKAGTDRHYRQAWPVAENPFRIAWTWRRTCANPSWEVHQPVALSWYGQNTFPQVAGNDPNLHRGNAGKNVSPQTAWCTRRQGWTCPVSPLPDSPPTTVCSRSRQWRKTPQTTLLLFP